VAWSVPAAQPVEVLLVLTWVFCLTGVYVIEDPPPAPREARPPVAKITASVIPVGLKLPAAGKNLMVGAH